MLRFLDALLARLGYVRAPRRPPPLVPPAAVPVVQARLVTIDPAMHDVMTRTLQIARAVRALEAQRDVARAEAEAEAAREAG